VAKLVLHIGTHKTATTTIQATFAKNQVIAKQRGLIYPVLPKQHHGLVADWIDLPKPYHYPEGSEFHWRKINEKYAGTDVTVLVSTEELSRGTKGNQVNFTELRSWITGFDEVKVVCMLREQVSFIQSIFFEVFKRGGAIKWAPFFNSCISGKKATGVYLDYSELYQRLLNDFEAEEISFIPYRPAGKSPDPVAHFLEHIGFSDLIDLVEQKDANRTPPSPIFGGKKTTMFSEAEYKRIVDLFEPINKSFTELYPRMKPEDLALADYDVESHVFRNGITPQQWLDLAKMMRLEGANQSS